MGTLETTHREAIEKPFQELTSKLQEVLGQRLVAYVAGVRSPRNVGRWARGENVPQNDETLHRVLGLYRVLVALEGTLSGASIRAWLIAENPQLEDEVPVRMLREAKVTPVVAAALNFAELVA